MSSTKSPECWYALNNGLLLMEGTDPDTGEATFFQLQSARRLAPDDLRRHDERTREHLTRFESRWAWVLRLGFPLLILSLLTVAVGFVLWQVDATEVVGGWMFWLGLPIAVLLYLTMKVGGWRLEGGIRKIQQDAGLVPGMVDEIEHARGLALIETHGFTFRLERESVT